MGMTRDELDQEPRHHRPLRLQAVPKSPRRKRRQELQPHRPVRRRFLLRVHGREVRQSLLETTAHRASPATSGRAMVPAATRSRRPPIFPAAPRSSSSSKTTAATTAADWKIKEILERYSAFVVRSRSSSTANISTPSRPSGCARRTRSRTRNTPSSTSSRPTPTTSRASACTSAPTPRSRSTPSSSSPRTTPRSSACPASRPPSRSTAARS